ncbi:MAG: FliG C-terminal domain-containing protein [Endomicrobiia bacterium]
MSAKNFLFLSFLLIFFNKICLQNLYSQTEATTASIDTTLFLLEQERKFEKEISDHLQKNILDKVLGEGKSSVIVDLELGLESERRMGEKKERTAEQKRKLGEIEYILPGIPNPKAVSREMAPGEAKVESQQSEATSVTTKLVIRRQTITVIHDYRIPQEKIDIVKDAIITALKINTKRGDALILKPAKFTSDVFSSFLVSILKPSFLLPLILTMLILSFLFGPLAGFLRDYVRTLRERGGTEISVDTKMEGGQPGICRPGGEGVGLTETELAEKEKKEKEKEKEEKYLPFQYVDDENLRRLIYLISKESPSTIAIVISYLKPEYVREVLVSLPESLQAEVALTLATAREIPQEEVMRIDNEIKQKIDFLVGGIDQLLKVIEKVDRQTRENILEYLKNEKPDLYDKVRKHIFLFEDTLNMPDQALQVVIRELKIENIARALRNAPQEIVNKFFSNMSAGAVSLVKEEMEFGRPLTPEQIEEERDNIVATVKRLENEGKIFIREKPRLIVEGVEVSESAGQFDEYFSYAVSLYNEGRYEESLPYFEYCVQLSPRNSDVYQYLGNALYTIGRYNDALTYFEKALDCNPQNQELKTFVEQFKASLVGEKMT